MTEQEKAIFNGQFDSYIGHEKSGDDAKAILSAIVSSNKTNKSKENLIVEVKVEDEEAKLEEDVDSLNEKIEEFLDEIDSDKIYYIKETYKSGIIISIAITEEQ